MTEEWSIIHDLAIKVPMYIRRNEVVRLRGRDHAVTVPVAVEMVVTFCTEVNFEQLDDWASVQGEPTDKVKGSLPRWRFIFFANALTASAEEKHRAEVCRRIAAEVEDLVEACPDIGALRKLIDQHLASLGVPWLV